jgi:hypothetical protein
MITSSPTFRAFHLKLKFCTAIWCNWISCYEIISAQLYGFFSELISFIVFIQFIIPVISVFRF